MTTLLKKDYQYSSVLWEEVMQRVQEIIRDEYNISPYVSPTLNPKTPSPFRIWSSAQGTDALYVGAWHKEYTISVNHYLKTEDSERFYKKVYEESERLYQLFFNNQGTQSTQTLGFFGGRPEGIQISQEGDYFRIEVLFTCEVLRADDVVYVQTLPSEIRATKRALELPFNFWSLDFDGTDDYIDAGSPFNLNLDADSITLSAWINYSGKPTSGNYFPIIYLRDKDLATDRIALQVTWAGGGASSTIGIAAYDGVLYSEDYGNFHVNADNVYNDNKWHHVVGISNQGVLSLYIDGVYQETSATTTMDIVSNRGGLKIGDIHTATPNYNGLMSEVAIFNSALSSSEISTIYNDGQPILLTENQGSYKSSGNLVAYYRMGSGSGDIREKDSAIFDQVNSGIGSELIDDTTFANADNTSDSTWGKWRSTGGFNALEDTIATFANNTMTIHDDGSETPMSDIGEKDYFNPSSGIYLLTCDITRTAGKLHFKIGNASSGTNHGTAEYDGTWAEGSGTIIFYIQVGTNTDPPMLRTHGDDGFIGTVKNFSIKKLNGNPGKMKNFDSLDFRTNVPLLYDKALFSNSLLFDGTDDQINCGSGSSIDNIFDGGGSVSLWFNPSAQSSTLGIIKKQYVGGWYFDLADHSGGTSWRGKFVQAFDGDNYQIQGSSRTFSIGNWYNVVIVYNSSATSNTATIYVNGEILSITTDSTPSGTRHDDSSGNLLIGDTGSYEFSGNIADVALFNSTLDATNITAMYNSGKPIDLTCDAGNYNNANNLVGYWKMGDGYLDELPSANINGAIVDQVTPIIGDDVLSHNIDDWTLGNNSGATSTKAYSDGVYTITRESEGTGSAYTYIIQSGIENNTPYKVNFSYKSTVQLEYTGDYDTASTRLYDATSEYVEITEYIITSATYVGKFQIRAVGNFELKNLTFKKVEGNPGLAKNMNASSQSISVPE